VIGFKPTIVWWDDYRTLNQTVNLNALLYGLNPCFRGKSGDFGLFGLTRGKVIITIPIIAENKRDV
jgi:hypothetical protein